MPGFGSFSLDILFNERGEMELCGPAEEPEEKKEEINLFTDLPFTFTTTKRQWPQTIGGFTPRRGRFKWIRKILTILLK